eukprot:gene2764-biopygen23088
MWHDGQPRDLNDCLGTLRSSFLACGWRKWCPGTCALFAFLPRVGARDLGIPAFTPRSGPPHARAPGAQKIWVVPGSSLAFHVY